MSTYPKNKLAQQVIAHCKAYAVKHIVIAPGSRNAPLIIGFTNHTYFKTYSIVDERAAAFFALGLAQQLQQPVAVVCTSGSAVLNFFPAVAEAFYSLIPLVVISADRPKHLLEIGDGQTIQQEGIFNKHIVFEANLNEAGTDNKQLLNQAFVASQKNKGPVHINVPFDEPLYETTTSFSENVNAEIRQPKPTFYINEVLPLWNAAEKKIVLIGAHYPDGELQQLLETLAQDPSVLILTENTANVSSPNFITSIDKLIFPFKEEELTAFKPDLLLSFGGLIVSKKIKQHLRKYKPKHHFHVDEIRAFDTYLSLTKHIKTSATNFLKALLQHKKNVKSNYQHYWLKKKKNRLQKHNAFLKEATYSDLKVFDVITNQLPENCMLQVSNSAVIRYTQLFDINPSINVFCNRGTSGIDGSTSTAIGAASNSPKQTVFITGDISFFYDSNALWNNYIPNNFRIILINNGGGGIFRFIPGPQQTEALPYFETPHQLTAKHLCNMHQIAYISARNLKDVTTALNTFFKPSESPQLLEIFTPRTENDKVLKAYFNFLKE
ncbi:MAG TPA: 2-succinyl-5-enolpyruvyl-6-hydroxy-3-cyclohexene-1-carboxylic-acid synthase [Flavobacteriaceae bacterium]|nr:2-succinyl-5-enolpyruvyl-6-hydroxy-3-cyclohexene-1-carboxylic-acid synthase [Flavobacteriaceae bacterium]